MPYLPSSANSSKTAFDAIREGKQKTAQAQNERRNNAPIAPKFTQRNVNESRQSTLQQRAQRAQNPVIPTKTTQQIGAERNRAAAESRAQVRSRIDQSRNG
jgi:hypothetical protein